MIGAVLLFQIAATSVPSEAPREAVVARSVDLSTVASRVRINRDALEGWVPAKGEPAPSIEWPEHQPEPVQRAREPEGPYGSRNPFLELEDSVNGFDQPRPWFYGAYGPYDVYGRPCAAPRHGGHGSVQPHLAPRGHGYGPAPQATRHPVSYGAGRVSGPARIKQAYR
jgi:hypothetical protein